MITLDKKDALFVVWAFFFQIVLIVHFAVRKRFFDSYTLKYGWIVYALCVPAVIISIILIVRGEKSWSYWLGGFLFVLFSAYGFWIDYVKQINWRSPLNYGIMFPYIFLYLTMIMFYWWPLALIEKRLWYAYGVLFVISTLLNITSH